MSVGLDALNKLQRARAESAGGSGAYMLDPTLCAKPQTNRLLATGFVLSLAVASFSFLRSGGNRAATLPSVHGSSSARESAAASPMVEPASPAQPDATAPLSIKFSVPDSAEIKQAQTSAPAPRTLLPGQNVLVDAYVEAGQVGGVDLRLGNGLGPIVLFNDMICHLNEVVNSALGIRLVRITQRSLTFQDAHGVMYQKVIASP